MRLIFATRRTNTPRSTDTVNAPAVTTRYASVGYCPHARREDETSTKKDRVDHTTCEETGSPAEVHIGNASYDDAARPREKSGTGQQENKSLSGQNEATATWPNEAEHRPTDYKPRDEQAEWREGADHCCVAWGNGRRSPEHNQQGSAVLEQDKPAKASMDQEER